MSLNIYKKPVRLLLVQNNFHQIDKKHFALICIFMTPSENKTSQLSFSHFKINFFCKLAIHIFAYLLGFYIFSLVIYISSLYYN